MATWKQESVAFYKLIECAECNHAMINKKIYIRPDGISICAGCFHSDINGDRKLRIYIFLSLNSYNSSLICMYNKKTDVTVVPKASPETEYWKILLLNVQIHRITK